MHAEAKNSPKKKSRSYFKLLEANVQRMLPGIPGAPVKTEYSFIIVWQAAGYPTSFFWRGENGWLPCDMKKAHKNLHTGKYDLAAAVERAIRKGDTLMLSPYKGNIPVPGEIPADAQNTLFFRTGGSGWLSYPVKNIRALPDIVNP